MYGVQGAGGTEGGAGTASGAGVAGPGGDGGDGAAHSMAVLLTNLSSSPTSHWLLRDRELRRPNHTPVEGTDGLYLWLPAEANTLIVPDHTRRPLRYCSM